MPSKEATFTKQQILRSNKFTGAAKDMLHVLLNENEQYTISQCNKILDKEKERVIK